MNKLFTKVLGVAAAGAIIVPAAFALASSESLSLNDKNATVNPTDIPTELLTPPFAQDFMKERDNYVFGFYKIINQNSLDGNGDVGSKWTYDFSGIEYDCLICPGMHYADGRGVPEDMDDWIITPAIKLEKGTKYTYTANLGAYLPSDTEKVEVYIGTQQTVAGMTTNLIPVTEITGVRYSDDTYKTLTKEFTVPADGNYYIGVRGCTKNATDGYNGFLLCFWGWSIDAGVKEGAPAKVNDLSVVAASDGSNKVDISFKTPTMTLGNTQMNSLTKAVIERNGEVVKEVANPAVGTEITFKDEAVTEGAQKYKVYCANSVGNGDPSTVSVYVGANIPTAVTNLNVELTDKVGEVSLSWDAPTVDVDGLPINAGTVSYNIYELTDDNSVPVAKNITTPNYTYSVCGPEDAQRFNSWTVEAVTSKGKSELTQTQKLAVGPSYTLPYAESFAGYKFQTAFTQDPVDEDGELSSKSDGSWRFISQYVEPQDNDGGLITMQGRYQGDSAQLVSGRIYLNPEVENPYLTFFYNGLQENNPDVLSVWVSVEGGKWQLVHNVEFGGPYWHKEKVSLKEFSGKTIQIRFVGTIYSQPSIPLDNIRIGALFNKNLTAGVLSAPEQVSFNTSIPLTLQVENTGNVESGNFTVDFYRNGEKLRTVDMYNLQPDETATALCNDRLSVDDPENIEYYAVINFEGDEYEKDNRSATVKTLLKLNNFPIPTVRAARMYEDGVNNKGEKNFDNIKIKWDAPVREGIEPKPVVETFEDCQGLETEIPGWTMYDKDGLQHVSISQLSFGSILDQPTSFFTVDVEAIAYTRPFQPISGDMVFASLRVAGSKQTDDWAILPMLSGKAQTISFYARSYSIGVLESFEVLTSTTGKDSKDFTKLAEEKDIDPYWTKYEYNVPDGTKYFAIRCTSLDKQLLIIDDVTYTPSYTEEGLPLVGYNVYCDNVKVNKTPVTDNFYIHKGGTVGKTYSVSAVYYKGESKPSAGFVSNTDGVESVEMLQGINVVGNTINVSATGEVAIYSIDGKVVYRGVANSNVSVKVESGVYVVKAGRETRKVVVR